MFKGPADPSPQYSEIPAIAVARDVLAYEHPNQNHILNFDNKT
jgi:hypothetical protein